MGAHRIDLSGRRFGFLDVVGRAPKPEDVVHRLSWFECRCLCGRIVIVRSDDLRMLKRRKCSDDCSYVVPKTRATFTTIEGRGEQQFEFVK
jgi:hypothetical protein